MPLPPCPKREARKAKREAYVQAQLDKAKKKRAKRFKTQRSVYNDWQYYKRKYAKLLEMFPEMRPSDNPYEVEELEDYLTPVLAGLHDYTIAKGYREHPLRSIAVNCIVHVTRGRPLPAEWMRCYLEDKTLDGKQTHRRHLIPKDVACDLMMEAIRLAEGRLRHFMDIIEQEGGRNAYTARRLTKIKT